MLTEFFERDFAVLVCVPRVENFFKITFLLHGFKHALHLFILHKPAMIGILSCKCFTNAFKPAIIYKLQLLLVQFVKGFHKSLVFRFWFYYNAITF